VVELAADEVAHKKLSDDEMPELRKTVDEIPTQTIEEVEKKRQQGAWVKHLERFGK